MRTTRLSLIALLFVAACSKSSGPATEPSPAPGVEVDDPAVNPSSVGSFDVATGKHMLSPARLATGPDGTVYVTDAIGNQVLGFKNGEMTLAIVGLDRPLGIALNGDKLYVGNAGRHDVEIYDLAKKSYVGTLGGYVEMPNAIAAVSDGEVYVVDSRRNVVKHYAADGTFLRRIGGTGTEPGQLMFPSPIAVDRDRVIIGDQGNHRIQMFTRNGTFIRTFGEEVPEQAETQEDYKGRFTRIQGLALNGSEIYVLDSYHAYVQVMNEAGSSKGFFGIAGDCASCIRLATDIAIDSEGRVLAADPDNRRWVALSTELR